MCLFCFQDGNTVLMEAVKMNSSEIVDIVLKVRANSNVKNKANQLLSV